MAHARLLAAALSLALASCGGGTAGRPPKPPPLVKGPDGKDYRLVQKAGYKAYYDEWGRIARLHWDRNGDRRDDHVAYYGAAARTPYRIDVDQDFDGRIDRWEEYDAGGRLLRVGAARRGGERPDIWSFVDPGGRPTRTQYDEDGDGLIDRTEHLEGGRVTSVEVDADRDGRADRWQRWTGGRMAAEDLDTDADGRPDRRVVYGPRGAVVGFETIPAAVAAVPVPAAPGR